MLTETKQQFRKQHWRADVLSKELEDWRGFKMLLAETSARIINLPVDRLSKCR